MAKAFLFIQTFQKSILGIGNFMLLFIISEGTYVISLAFLSMWTQRVSLRKNIGLSNDFFKNKKEYWNKELTFFNDKEKICNILEQGNAMLILYQLGFFNYAILMTCNIMELILDSLKEELLLLDENFVNLFEDKNKRISYPTILSNIGFHVDKQKLGIKITSKQLWHSLRNDIAHRNKLSSYDDIKNTFILFIEFVDNFPILSKNFYISLTV